MLPPSTSSPGLTTGHQDDNVAVAQKTLFLCLTSCGSDAASVGRTDAADNWKPSKKKRIERIDGIVALIMALERASRHEELRSIYELRGLLFITADDGWGDGRDD
jgi:Terminase large subunit, endonuclease domain